MALRLLAVQEINEGWSVSPSLGSAIVPDWSILNVVSLLEAFHSSHGVNYSLLACIERVTSAANLDPELWTSCPSGESVAAKAGHLGIIIVLRMNLRFHCKRSLFSYTGLLAHM